MRIIQALSLIGIIFVMQYEGYYYDPCHYDVDTGMTTCYAINGYEVRPETVYLNSVKEVEDQINKSGIEHISGIYKIDYDIIIGSSSIKKVEITHRVTVKE
jgi:hypothetical protein